MKISKIWLLNIILSITRSLHSTLQINQHDNKSTFIEYLDLVESGYSVKPGDFSEANEFYNKHKENINEVTNLLSYYLQSIGIDNHVNLVVSKTVEINKTKEALNNFLRTGLAADFLSSLKNNYLKEILVWEDQKQYNKVAEEALKRNKMIERIGLNKESAIILSGYLLASENVRRTQNCIKLLRDFISFGGIDKLQKFNESQVEEKEVEAVWWRAFVENLTTFETKVLQHIIRDIEPVSKTPEIREILDLAFSSTFEISKKEKELIKSIFGEKETVTIEPIKQGSVARVVKVTISGGRELIVKYLKGFSNYNEYKKEANKDMDSLKMLNNRLNQLPTLENTIKLLLRIGDLLIEKDHHLSFERNKIDLMKRLYKDIPGLKIVEIASGYDNILSSNLSNKEKTENVPTIINTLIMELAPGQELGSFINNIEKGPYSKAQLKKFKEHFEAFKEGVFYNLFNKKKAHADPSIANIIVDDSEMKLTLIDCGRTLGYWELGNIRKERTRLHTVDPIEQKGKIHESKYNIRTLMIELYEKFKQLDKCNLSLDEKETTLRAIVKQISPILYKYNQKDEELIEEICASKTYIEPKNNNHAKRRRFIGSAREGEVAINSAYDAINHFNNCLKLSPLKIVTESPEYGLAQLPLLMLISISSRFNEAVKKRFPKAEEELKEEGLLMQLIDVEKVTSYDQYPPKNIDFSEDEDKGEYKDECENLFAPPIKIGNYSNTATENSDTSSKTNTQIRFKKVLYQKEKQDSIKSESSQPQPSSNKGYIFLTVVAIITLPLIIYFVAEYFSNKSDI